jgi:aspartyl-tRNA(Asn)/glutamyl-tRNA(Gln) amidotransferase subunit A
MTIAEAGGLLRQGGISSAELVEESLRRIRELDPALNAFLTVTEEAARRAARAADAELARGLDRGPLHGVPVAVKDLFETRGVRTTGGSKILADYVPERDAAAVERLAEAGAVMVGKTNLHELAYGVTSNNPHYGAVRNPRDRERSAGGSSGGSAAAVASGMVFAALGTDTGGSIRIPASFCGCVGLKPTYGRVSRYGVLPLSESQDHVGPLARTVHDAALVLNAIAGYDPRDKTSSSVPVEDYTPRTAGLEGVRFGVVEPVSEAVMAALGAAATPVAVPDLEEINVIGRTILLAEAAAEYGRYDLDSIGEDVRALLEEGRRVPATDYIHARRLRKTKQAEFGRVWEQADLLLLPTTAMTAPRLDDRTFSRLAATRLVRPFDVLGLPAISIPCGVDADGLPVGLQLAAPAFQEALLLRAAAALERRQNAL